MYTFRGIFNKICSFLRAPTSNGEGKKKIIINKEIEMIRSEKCEKKIEISLDSFRFFRHLICDVIYDFDSHLNNVWPLKLGTLNVPKFTSDRIFLFFSFFCSRECWTGMYDFTCSEQSACLSKFESL